MPVETGMQNDDYVQILSGVSEGDVVLYTGAATGNMSGFFNMGGMNINLGGMGGNNRGSNAPGGNRAGGNMGR